MAIPAICETDLIKSIMSQIHNGKDEKKIEVEIQEPISVMTMNMKMLNATYEDQKKLLSVIFRFYPSAIIFYWEPPEKFQDVLAGRNLLTAHQQ